MPAVLDTTSKRRRRWPRVLIGALALLAIALAINTYVQDRQTKRARADIGRIVTVPGGALQVRIEGKGPSLVLLHGFAGSMHWWSMVAPKLARTHRLIRIDLLGHGGSDKPRSGYSMQAQADAVADVMMRLKVDRADIAGHSMGGYVATALAQRHPNLVKRVVVIDSGANADDGKLPFVARLIYVPVLGELLKPLTPRSIVRSALKSAFAPAYKGKVPERFVDGVKSMTYSSYDKSHSEATGFVKTENLPDRLRSTHKSLLVIFGARDQLVDPQALKEFKVVPGAQTRYIANAGHTPIVEEPRQTARLMLRFLGR